MRGIQFYWYRMRQPLFFVFVMLFSFSAYGFGQECGPGCPVCSGTGNSSGALLAQGSSLSSFLFIPGDEEERGVISFRSGLTSSLDAGLGYVLDTKKLLWSVRWQPVKEVESSWKPSVILGTGSVQAGGSDQAVFFFLTKAVDIGEIISARASLGTASLFPDFDRAYFLANLTLTVTDRWSPFFSFDGINFHYGLTFIPFDWLYLGVMMIESKDPAILIGTRWGLKKE